MNHGEWQRAPLVPSLGLESNAGGGLIEYPAW